MYEGKNYLMAMDCYSRFLELEELRQTMSKVVIVELSKMFARFSTPEIVRSDNVPNLGSYEFKNFARVWGFRHIS